MAAGKSSSWPGACRFQTLRTRLHTHTRSRQIYPLAFLPCPLLTLAPPRSPLLVCTGSLATRADPIPIGVRSLSDSVGAGHRGPLRLWPQPCWRLPAPRTNSCWEIGFVPSSPERSFACSWTNQLPQSTGRVLARAWITGAGTAQQGGRARRQCAVQGRSFCCLVSRHYCRRGILFYRRPRPCVHCRTALGLRPADSASSWRARR